MAREYPPETLWGGIGTFTYNLAQGLSEIGHDVDVLAFTFGEESSVDDNGVTVHRIQSPRVPFSNKTWWDFVGKALSPFAYFYSRKISRKLDELNESRQYDVIDLPEHIGEGYSVVRSKRYPTLVRLYTPLSLIGHLGLNRTTNALDYYLIGILERSSIKHCSIVNAPSKALSELVMDKFSLDRNTELIYNPIDTDRFKPVPAEMSDERIKILFVGGLTDRKGVHILAQAIPKILKDVPAAEFTIIGNDSAGVEGYASMVEYMMHVFSSQGVEGSVDILPPVPYDQLPDVYNSADLSVVPSLYDNSPYTCLEAMACGLPVVGTSAGGMPEYIVHETTGLVVPPGDIDALAGAVVWLTSDRERLEGLGRNARERAVEVYGRKQVAQQITALYSEAMISHRSRFSQ